MYEEEIASTFRARVDQGHAPAVVYAVFNSGGIYFHGGYGTSRLGEAAPTTSTVFRIASCTKSFTAAMLLILRDRGELSLDAPITDFVPLFHSTASAREPIIPTVRMLMTMSGGLPTDDPWGDRQEAISAAELGALVQTGPPLVSIPGTAFEYSNLGYALLGQVIESITRRSYFDTMTSELLEPLGLTSTSFAVPHDTSSDVALGYRMSDQGWTPLPFSSPGAFSPMGGLFSTAQDLARWALWLASAWEYETSSPDLLSLASRREMQQINRFVAMKDSSDGSFTANGYGFGLFVDESKNGGKTISHSGGYPGFSAHMRWDAQAQIGVVGFENATYSGVAVPVSEALILATGAQHARTIVPWPATRECAGVASRLVANWEDDLADRICAANVALDTPYGERSAHIRRAIEAVGGLLSEVPELDEAVGDSPAHLVWFLAGRNGRLRCEMRLAPTSPPTVQTLIVEALV